MTQTVGDGATVQPWDLHDHKAEADSACPLCSAIWEYLEAQPGFNEELEKGRADIAAGRGVKWRDIKRTV